MSYAPDDIQSAKSMFMSQVVRTSIVNRLILPDRRQGYCTTRLSDLRDLHGTFLPGRQRFSLLGNINDDDPTAWMHYALC